MAGEQQEEMARLMIDASGTLLTDDMVRSRFFELMTKYCGLMAEEWITLINSLQRNRPRVIQTIGNQIHRVNLAMANAQIVIKIKTSLEDIN